MGKFRGLLLMGYMKYLREKGVLDSVLAGLDENLRRTLQSIDAKNWYSTEDVIYPFYRAVDKLVAKGDSRFFIDMDKFGAMDNEKWYLKLFFKFASPMKIIKKFPVLWSLYNDTGRIEIADLKENSATARLIEYNSTLLADLTVQGWGEYALERVGAKNFKAVQTKCIERGDEYTEWRMTWE